MPKQVNTLKAPRSRPNPGLEFLKLLAKKQMQALVISVMFGLLATLSMIIQWLSLAHVANQIIMLNQTLFSAWLGFALFGVSTLLRPVLSKGKDKFAQDASWQARQLIRKYILTEWQHRSPLKQNQHSPAAAATQWVEEVEAMDGYFSRYWPQQLLAVLSPLLIIIPVFYLNWICGVLLLISAPLIPLFMILVGLGAESINQKYFVMRQRLAGHFLDRVKHLTTIKLFNAQQHELNEIQYKSEHYRKVIMQTLKVAFLSSTVLEFFTSVAIACVAIYIGFALFGAITWGPSASLTLFSGLAILLLAPEFFQPLRNLSQFYHDRATALAASNSLSLGLEHLKKGNNKPATPFESSELHMTYVNPTSPLSVKDLIYGYNEGLSSKLNFTLVQGDIMTISGPSGSGKSSLLHTLAGYLPPIAGTINLPVCDPTQPKIAFLPQQPWLMRDTVLNNIRLFKSDVTQDELNCALQTVNLSDDLTQRSLGLDTDIEEQGRGFSGGQGHRIAFLRLMLAPTPLILMDEPTASLDKHNRELVIEQLEILAKKSILIIATHDEDILKIATQRLVLTEQQGTSRRGHD